MRLPPTTISLEREEESDLSHGSSERVLIIEDESIIATDMALIVTDLGFNAVGPARTHHEALALGIETSPAIIIADIKLGDGPSGITTVDDILKNIDASVIFVTGLPELLSAGGEEPYFVVPKPFPPERLRDVVMEASKGAHICNMIQRTKLAISKLAQCQ